MEGEGSSVGFRACGFTGLRFVAASSFGVFFLSVFVVSSAALFLVLERVSGLFWVHFRVILKSDSSLFVHDSLFQKHVFRLHETIHFQIWQAWVSVLFR